MIAKVTSLPVPGFAKIQWQGQDSKKFTTLLRKLYYSNRPLTENQLRELDRLRKQYGLDKYYLFS